MTEKVIVKTTGTIMGNEYVTSQFKLSRLDTDPVEIAEKQRLLEWLKYNDCMYFEKIQRTNEINCKERYWFQTYVNMPLNHLRKKVKYISSLNNENEKYGI